MRYFRTILMKAQKRLPALFQLEQNPFQMFRQKNRRKALWENLLRGPLSRKMTSRKRLQDSRQTIRLLNKNLLKSLHNLLLNNKLQMQNGFIIQTVLSIFILNEKLKTVLLKELPANAEDFRQMVLHAKSRIITDWHAQRKTRRFLT